MDAQRKAGGEGAAPAKAAPAEVIGKRTIRGRLNKRLLLGVLAVGAVVMLLVSLLPGGGNGKADSADSSTVYGADAMPQEVRELALRAPAAPVVSTGSEVQGVRGVSGQADVFQGYGTAPNQPAARGGTPASAVSSRDYEGMARADDAVAAEEAARRAPMEVATRLVGSTATAGEAGSPQQEQGTGGMPASPAVGYLPAGTAAGATTTVTPGQVFRDFNDQAGKLAFSRAAGQAGAAAVGELPNTDLLPYTIFAGSIISAALQTAINTDLPGEILATVSENVFNSISGHNLLVPQGSRLLASYSSSVSFGQRRVQVAWQRLIRPDGVSIELSNMNGVDSKGASGYPGWVDQHLWEYAKGIGLMALFSIINGQLQYSLRTVNNQGVADIANSVTAGIDQVGSQFTGNVMNVQPTITVAQGTRVAVFVNRDIILPPVKE